MAEGRSNHGIAEVLVVTPAAVEKHVTGHLLQARLQRRDLQPRGAPAAARGGRPPLPHALRHRDDRPCLRAVGRRLRRAASAACSRSRSGTRRGGGCCSRATASASSRSTGRVAGDRLLFGSEIKAILASGLVARARRTSARSRSCSSTRYLSGAETLFKGIQKLLPGHAARVRARRESRRGSTGTCRSARRARVVERCRTRGGRRSSARCSKSRSACG